MTKKITIGSKTEKPPYPNVAWEGEPYKDDFCSFVGSWNIVNIVFDWWTNKGFKFR